MANPVLTETLNKMFEAQRENVVTYYTKFWNEHLELARKYDGTDLGVMEKDGYHSYSPSARKRAIFKTLSSLLKVKYSYGRNVRHLREDAEEFVNRQIQLAVEGVMSGFMHKMTEKLEGIIKDRELVEATANGGIWTSDVVFNFKDGGRFTLTNRIEMAVSSKGTVFNRYPSRFTNVWLNAETKMAQPSEAKMKKEF